VSLDALRKYDRGTSWARTRSGLRGSEADRGLAVRRPAWCRSRLDSAGWVAWADRRILSCRAVHGIVRVQHAVFGWRTGRSGGCGPGRRAGREVGSGAGTHERPTLDSTLPAMRPWPKRRVSGRSVRLIALPKALSVDASRRRDLDRDCSSMRVFMLFWISELGRIALLSVL
jgi:hypothetical protein